jgi:hypothetical protein
VITHTLHDKTNGILSMVNDNRQTKWSRDDEAILVQTLRLQKASGNWRVTTPKKSAWAACEKALAGSEVVSGGASKTLVAIKNRWQRVRFDFLGYMR